MCKSRGWLGENTAAQAQAFALLELDLIKVKGKKHAVRIYTLAGDTALAATSAFKELRAKHNSMLAAYRAHYDLAALRRAVDQAFTRFDVLLLPTAGTIYEIAEIEAWDLIESDDIGHAAVN